ncbi:MAG: TIGR01777 family oxidoreductase [Flavobacteriales bacterium]
MKVLISGGSGMLGSYLIPLLVSKGHTIVNLTTRSELAGTTKQGLINVFWNPSSGELDRALVTDLEAIINLAGFNLANRWTKKNQQLMVESRLDSTKLLIEIANNSSSSLKVFVSASGSGFYPDSLDLMDEEGPKGEGFISDLTADWEKVLDPLEKLNVRVVKMRTAVILDKNHGALSKMLPFFKLGLGAAVGNGKQYISWLHAEDAAAAYVFAIENNAVKGVYNLTTDEPVTNKVFSSQLAVSLKKPLFLPNVPGFILKLLFGKMANLVLRSNRMSAKKIQSAGYKFKFPNLQQALNNVFQS